MEQNVVNTKNQHLIGLDLFRIAAAFVVFLFHSGQVACDYWILQPFVKMGPVFMTGFFMLSGFSLYLSYECEDLTKIAFIKLFYKKRAASVLPLYWFLYVTYVLFLGTESWLQNVILIPVEVLGMQSAYSSLYLYSHNSATWFISCILFCYLFYPFMSECVKQLSIRIRFILLILTGFIMLHAPIVIHVFEQESIYPNPIFRMIEFFMGVLLASLFREPCVSRFVESFLARKTVLCLEAAVLLAAVREVYVLGIGRGDYMLYNWICLPIFSLMLPGLAQAEFPILQKLKAVRYLSSISYAFYLAQFFTWPMVRKLILFFENNTTSFKFAASLIICVILSILMHEFVEKPCKKFWMHSTKCKE